MPEKTALIVAHAPDREHRWSYSEIDTLVRRLAGGLRAMGLPRGARLMIRMDNDVWYIVTFFAALAAGLVPLPSSSALTSAEAEFLLVDSGAAAIALSDALALAHAAPEGVSVLRAEDIEALARTHSALDYGDTAADDPGFLIYTSGTVGRPKGVLHAHRSAWGRRPMYDGWSGLAAGDVVLHAGAFNWTYTLGVGLIDPWANGATAVLYNGPNDPGVWTRLIARHNVTIFATVPSLYRRILKYGDCSAPPLASLRHGLTAGEALPAAVLDTWGQTTGKPLYEALGMSEISTYISTGPGMAIRPGSPGKPQRGRRIAILAADEPEPRELPPGDVGLLAVHRSDPGLMLGYWNRPDEEAAVFRGEWFCGGDLAHIDNDGYVWFAGRHDDILNPMGYRLSPLEVEGVLARHPMVHEVAVGEIAVASGISVLAAFVVPHGDGDEAALLAFAKEHLASYKLPRRVIFVDHLPRTRNGKLLRRELPRRDPEPSNGG
ncbi:MAG: acyl-CoA synthetase [Rhodospirillales bacterium]|nr:acyl-CoA synthetase [Rhodospirillales bacterium]